MRFSKPIVIATAFVIAASAWVGCEDGDVSGSNENEGSTSRTRCKWCEEGEATFLPYGGFSIYVCGNIDADGCGSWEFQEACLGKGFPRQVAAEVDELGFAARTPGNKSWKCSEPLELLGADECASAADCGGPKWDCQRPGAAGVCVQKTTWVTGTGTWDYGTNHFEWSVESSRLNRPDICQWVEPSHWRLASKRCSGRLSAYFAAPDGGLKSATINFFIDEDTPVDTPISNRVGIDLDVTAPEFAGIVSKTVDTVTYTTIDLRPGGFAEGTWRVEGTVQGTNIVAASGNLMVRFP